LGYTRPQTVPFSAPNLKVTNEELIFRHRASISLRRMFITAPVSTATEYGCGCTHDGAVGALCTG
jgi:hypothetical protein